MLFHHSLTSRLTVYSANLTVVTPQFKKDLAESGLDCFTDGLANGFASSERYCGRAPFNHKENDSP
jgi:hypothetical protein